MSDKTARGSSLSTHFRTLSSIHNNRYADCSQGFSNSAIVTFLCMFGLSECTPPHNTPLCGTQRLPHISTICSEHMGMVDHSLQMYLTLARHTFVKVFSKLAILYFLYFPHIFLFNYYCKKVKLLFYILIKTIT